MWYYNGLNISLSITSLVNFSECIFQHLYMITFDHFWFFHRVTYRIQDQNSVEDIFNHSICLKIILNKSNYKITVCEQYMYFFQAGSGCFRLPTWLPAPRLSSPKLPECKFPAISLTPASENADSLLDLSFCFRTTLKYCLLYSKILNYEYFLYYQHASDKSFRFSLQDFL